MEEEIIGTTGKIVDLFNANLTQEEWDALCVIPHDKYHYFATIKALNLQPW